MHYYSDKECGKVPSSLSASIFNIPIKYRWIWTIVIIAVCCLFYKYFYLSFNLTYLPSCRRKHNFFYGAALYLYLYLYLYL